jgi:hypothetical protein
MIGCFSMKNEDRFAPLRREPVSGRFEAALSGARI